jgi:peroxiredoxin
LNQNGARLTLAVFFKTTCPTCATIWPYLEKLHQAYRGVGLAVWGISQEGREPSAEFAHRGGSTFPILVDHELRVSRIYDPDFVPTLLLIDSTGHILDSMAGLNKTKLNHLSQTAAAHFGVPPATITHDNDGTPAFKPG